MRFIRTHKLQFAVLNVLLYVFVVFFSQSFHHHGSGSFFKDFHFSGGDKKISKGGEMKEFSDCLSCHILHGGNAVMPEDFHFNFFDRNFFRQEFSAYQKRFSAVAFTTVQLRGPPHFPV